MKLNVAKEAAALNRLTTNDLRARYAEVFGEATHANNKPWLVKRIAWRLQAQADGDIFQLYAEHQALLPVVHELARRGWTNKRWTTRKGRERGGRPFDRTGLYNLLTNVAYAGKVRHKQAVFPGQHAAIVDEALWQRVQTTLQRNGRSGGAGVRNRFGALLKGLLHCTACGCAMSPTHCKNGTKRYRYYTCTAANKKGWQSCPAKSIPAGAIEEFVVAQIHSVGQDPAVLAEVISQANEQVSERLAALTTEERMLGRDLAH